MSSSRRIAIPESELSFSFSRSGGPGGQNVNKVETKVTVSFDYAASQVLSWEEKGRLGKSKAVLDRVDASGAIVVSSQAYRTQALNKKAAVEKLHELIQSGLRRVRPRVPTKKTRSSQRKRLERKHIRGEVKTARRKVDSSDD